MCFSVCLFVGYSIFVVKGNLQPCEADRYLKHHPVSKEDILKLQQQIKPKGETSNQLADTAEHSGIFILGASSDIPGYEFKRDRRSQL